MPTFLDISELRVHYSSPQGNPIHALNGVNLQVRRGEVLGLLGESGCGKSTLAKLLLGLLPKSAQIISGKICLEGKDLSRLREQDMAKIRGSQIAMIWQEPGQALSPVMKVGDQVAQLLRVHRGWPAKRCRVEAEALLQKVQLVDQGRQFYDAYPHQLSGGQQQRVATAQLLACAPALVIADEPTASLDAEVADGILDLLLASCAERNSSLLLITHHPQILERRAHRVAVMYGGRIVEEGLLDAVFQQPRHPYTKALLACVPPAPRPRTAAEPIEFLPTIPGTAPNPESLPTGCSFAPRCTGRMDICEHQCPPATQRAPEGQVECFLHA